MKYIIAILLLICGFCFGYSQQEKEIITEYVIVYEEVEVVWVVKEIQLREFESWHELSVWQANNFIRDAEVGECVDTALELQRRALEDGYLMSTEMWGDGLREGHMICSAVIGDKIYFLEPSGTISWLAGIKK